MDKKKGLGTPSELRDALAELKKMTESGFKQVTTELEEIKKRQDAHENYHESHLPTAGRKLTPAVEQTLTELEELATMSSWVAVVPLSKKVQKAVPTVEADLRRLLELGLIVRRPEYFFTASGRKLRKYTYRPKSR